MVKGYIIDAISVRCVQKPRYNYFDFHLIDCQTNFVEDLSSCIFLNFFVSSLSKKFDVNIQIEEDMVC